MASTLLLLLLLLWLQGCTSGVPAESVYSKIQRLEGETLSVQCSYKNRKKHVEGKVWCKIRRKKCEPGFSRVWAPGPRYLLQDDAQAKVFNITMVALKRQDSGRYWCMRNSSGTLYPLMGFQLEVSPEEDPTLPPRSALQHYKSLLPSQPNANLPLENKVPTAERRTPLTQLALTQLADILKSGVVVTTGHAPTSGPGAAFTSSVTMLTPGVLTLARLLPSPASGTIRLSSMTGYSFTSPSTPGPTRNQAQMVTAAPSNARAASEAPTSVSTKAGPLRTTSPTLRMGHTSRSLLNKLSPIRPREANPTLLAGVLSLLSVPVMMMAVYGFWKKRHVGSYSICRSPARPWRDPPGRPEPPWKPAWFKATYGVGELFPEGPQEVTEVKMGTCLDWSQVGG